MAFYESFMKGTEPVNTAAALPAAYKKHLDLEKIDWQRSVDDAFAFVYNDTGPGISLASVPTSHRENDPILWRRARTQVFSPPSDFYEFRQIRSEVVLTRIRQNFNFTDITLRRVSNGLYIVHKERGTHAFFGLDCPKAEEYSEEKCKQNKDWPCNKNPSEMVCRLFKPYSYTVGLRYILPFADIRDILIYAPGLPLFAQGVFLKSCIEYQKAHGAFKVGMPYTGLFPFAPHVRVSFMELPVDHLLTTKDPCPSLLLIYERFAMEVLCDPEFRSAGMDSNPAKCGMFPALWCNSDSETNQRLTTLAEQWRQNLLAANDSSKYDLSLLQ
ncbi:hypothetical protein K450DRAFT_239871 [Umbelopsis ramanniana AG]|uniref:Uncharacterized protein n=1 Tax=Umbelopsis ramanniana AG TaxID=1314678 RepID=A0AAD5EB07_UMBRA|nr:uncharacterized protein K450DRAFT_239871 [Umbelopsis ramanniana AG]KAI8579949.1 hypothetical protein K450DRAFT_239871 [Umbelopsis ramanniana AG]